MESKKGHVYLTNVKLGRHAINLFTNISILSENTLELNGTEITGAHINAQSVNDMSVESSIFNTFTEDYPYTYTDRYSLSLVSTNGGISMDGVFNKFFIRDIYMSAVQDIQISLFSALLRDFDLGPTPSVSISSQMKLKFLIDTQISAG